MKIVLNTKEINKNEPVIIKIANILFFYFTMKLIIKRILHKRTY